MKKDVIRTCIVCRKKELKDNLLRLVIAKDLSAVVIGDNKAQGRGTYICNSKECINKCIKSKVLNKVLKKNIPSEIYEELGKVE